MKESRTELKSPGFRRPFFSASNIKLNSIIHTKRIKSHTKKKQIKVLDKNRKYVIDTGARFHHLEFSSDTSNTFRYTNGLFTINCRK